jgi:hypothetical protein
VSQALASATDDFSSSVGQLSALQKIKERRISELSEAGSIHTPGSTPPHQLSVILSSDHGSNDSQQQIKSLAQLNKNHSLLNSPSTQSPNSLVGSPRAYKKLLLSKVVNETITSLKCIGENREETAEARPEKLDLNSLVGNGYEAIEENVYRCQRYVVTLRVLLLVGCKEYTSVLGPVSM